MFIFTLVAIVAMSGCEKESITPDNEPTLDYENYVEGEYYKELGGYVLVHRPYDGRTVVANEIEVGSFTIDEIETAADEYSIHGFSDWRIPVSSEINSMCRKWHEKMNLIEEEWYWDWNNAFYQLRWCYGGDATKDPVRMPATGEKYQLRVVRDIVYEPVERTDLPQ